MSSRDFKWAKADNAVLVVAGGLFLGMLPPLWFLAVFILIWWFSSLRYRFVSRSPAPRNPPPT